MEDEAVGKQVKSQKSIQKSKKPGKKNGKPVPYDLVHIPFGDTNVVDKILFWKCDEGDDLENAEFLVKFKVWFFPCANRICPMLIVNG